MQFVFEFIYYFHCFSSINTPLKQQTQVTAQTTTTATANRERKRKNAKMQMQIGGGDKKKYKLPKTQIRKRPKKKFFTPNKAEFRGNKTLKLYILYITIILRIPEQPPPQ